MFRFRLGLGAASMGLLFALSGPPALAQAPAPGANAPKQSEGTPKRGGTLTYMIPADAPPSFDGHRETTYATATEELLESHDRMAEQVHDLAHQIADLQSRLPLRTRAIA